MTQNDIRKKYQDAFRNLSLELKKKIRSVKEDRDGDGIVGTEQPSRATPLDSEKKKDSHFDQKYLQAVTEGSQAQLRPSS